MSPRFVVRSVTGYRINPAKVTAHTSSHGAPTDWIVNDSANCYKTVGEFPAPGGQGSGAGKRVPGSMRFYTPEEREAQAYALSAQLETEFADPSSG